MPGALDVFVGRKEQLSALERALTDAAHGCGTLTLVSGEPGIGKSRLVEELARRTEPGHVVLWGRCWEEGGAPPFWPFAQVLRVLRRKRSVSAAAFAADSRRPWLGQLLPELGTAEAIEPAGLEPDARRFRLFDSVVGALSEVAEAEPLLLILEDLHVADGSSLELLEFLTKQIESTRIAAVGTLRDAKLGRAPGALPLSRLLQRARRLPLSRFDRSAVAAFLTTAQGHPAEAELVDAMMATTEGNPLFVTEVARGRTSSAHPPAPDDWQSIPSSLQSAIRERASHLSESAAEIVAGASVIGRQFEAEQLATLMNRDRRSLTTPLNEAVDRSFLAEVAPDVFRFSHALVRETIHRDVSLDRRQALHQRMAALLRTRRPVPWSAVAQHLIEGGPATSFQTIEALRAAGDASMLQLAFAEAVAFYRNALARLDAHGTEDGTVRVEMLLRLAAALHHAGGLEEARASCDLAIAMARRLDDARLFAQAVLERGSVFDIGVVSETLVARLEEGLERLGEEDSCLRAQLMARLAAARQPALPPEGPFTLAREAISMARRLGDERTLLDVLTNGISALMDLGDPEERLVLNREHAALAERLGNPLEVFRARARLVFDAAELGEAALSRASVEDCAALVASLDLRAHR